MAMSKQDYEMLAGIIAMYGNMPAMTTREKQLVWKIAVAFASRARVTNVSFDQAKFMAACKLQNPEGLW